jgi:DnaJ-class molecular chaperone
MDPNRILQGWIEVFQKEMQQWMKDLLKDAFNPTLFQHFMKTLGIDMSQVPGMIGKQPGIDPYAVLGLSQEASDQEIRARYRDLLKKLHPDTAGMEGTSFLLQMVLAAYQMISQERKWQ